MPRPVDHSCSHAHERHHFDVAEPGKPKAVTADDAEDDEAETQAKGVAGDLQACVRSVAID